MGHLGYLGLYLDHNKSQWDYLGHVNKEEKCYHFRYF